MNLSDWLDDLSVRFIVNLPPAELSHVPRICFQVEEAHWFYEDFIRPAAAAAGDPLPGLNLKTFCLKLFQHCPILSGYSDAQHVKAYEEFLAYKVRVPVRGAILLDEKLENVVLVKGMKKNAAWSFPRGKINHNEDDLDCAIREVFEETGLHLREAGLVSKDGDKSVRSFDAVMREQNVRLFVFHGVPLDFGFEPQTRGEISKIAWFPLTELPGFKKRKKQQAVEQTGKFYMVAPFLGPLKRWINQQKKVQDP
ncbi:DCP2-domain-containing protein, partial [Piedraia hortae CBS 480.64]